MDPVPEECTPFENRVPPAVRDFPPPHTHDGAWNLSGSIESTKVATRVIIALAKNAGCLQYGSHMLLSLLASYEKQA